MTQPTLITGAAGQLGTAFGALAPSAVALSRTDLDLSQPSAIPDVLARVRPSTVINCAGYTAVDRAEQEEALATTVNSEAVAAMAAWCAGHGARFVTFSTDYVFSGESDRPWVESDPVDPVNAYGRSKVAGEAAAIDHGGLVVRTSWVVSGTHNNFLATMLRLGQERRLRVVDDQHGCPTMAADLATATVAALDVGATGLLHLSNQGATTWYEFARTALERAAIDADIEPCGSDEFPTPARRPRYSVLGSERLDALGMKPLPPWRESLPDTIEELFTNGVVERP